MEFSSDIGRLQRRAASSMAGMSRRHAILEALPVSKGDHVLDIGCGGGHLLDHLAKDVGDDGHVFGLDPSADQLAEAKTHCAEHDNVTLLHSFADAIDLPDASCHAITSTQTLEYIEDVDASLAEATRVLMPGGWLVNVSILWDHFCFYGADADLNARIHDAFRAHCHHQMLPMELPGKLTALGYRHIRDTSLAFVNTRRNANTPAFYVEQLMAGFALGQGVAEADVTTWREQLAAAEAEGRFGFTSFPVLTAACRG